MLPADQDGVLGTWSGSHDIVVINVWSLACMHSVQRLRIVGSRCHFSYAHTLGVFDDSLLVMPLHQRVFLLCAHSVAARHIMPICQPVFP